jgi:hypothetical protein
LAKLLGELEAEALEVLRLVIRQTDRGENLDADLFERAKAIVERYNRAMMKGHEAPNVVPLKRD